MTYRKQEFSHRPPPNGGTIDSRSKRTLFKWLKVFLFKQVYKMFYIDLKYSFGRQVRNILLLMAKLVSLELSQLKQYNNWISLRPLVQIKTVIIACRVLCARPAFFIALPRWIWMQIMCFNFACRKPVLILQPGVDINWAASFHQLSLCRLCRGYRPSRREEPKKTSPVVDTK